MTTIFDVVKYVLDKYGAMSAMKLQKLLFYSQAMSLVWDDLPIFEDDFEAWAKGSVFRSLLNTHKGKFMLNNSELLKPYKTNVSHLTDEQKKTINAVVSSLIDYPPYVLSDMVHQEKPWQEACGNLLQSVHCQAVISETAMLEYYLANW